MNPLELQLFPSSLNIIEQSLENSSGKAYGLAKTGHGYKLAVLRSSEITENVRFDGEFSEFGEQSLLLCPLSHQNAQALRAELRWLQPQCLGLKTSAGMGDRLGVATPGHVRAVNAVRGRVAPIFAQQSIREMRRTGRNPQNVLDDATWGMFEAGWHEGAGADADHLKTEADIDACISAGFTFYTFDAGDFVDNFARSMGISDLSERIDQLPSQLLPPATGLIDKSFEIEGHKIEIPEEELYRAIVKYGRAVARVVEMYSHLSNRMGSKPFEVEISMDETEEPTTPVEHLYIVSELNRLGVKWVSLAPRFVGRFEKGVDYIGNLQELRSVLAVHAAIARKFGPYKLSLHSGSDKFSIYSIFMEETLGLAHLKTAGTSYLEALRTIAAIKVDLFKEIYAFALNRYASDKLSYHVSAQIDRSPTLEPTLDCTGLLDQFDARQILHVTFGSVLTEKADGGNKLFFDRIMSFLDEYREAYFSNLEAHFTRHLLPFAASITT